MLSQYLVCLKRMLWIPWNKVAILLVAHSSVSSFHRRVKEGWDVEVINPFSGHGTVMIWICFTFITGTVHLFIEFYISFPENLLIWDVEQREFPIITGKQKKNSEKGIRFYQHLCCPDCLSCQQLTKNAVVSTVDCHGKGCLKKEALKSNVQLMQGLWRWAGTCSLYTLLKIPTGERLVGPPRPTET